MRDRIAAIPGVTPVSFADTAPLEDAGRAKKRSSKTAPSGESGSAPIRRFKFVAPGFFAAVGTQIVTGRDITWDDIYQHRPVVMVSENLAREHWRTRRGRARQAIRENPTSPWREIVGVVGRRARRRDAAAGAGDGLLAVLMEQVLGQPPSTFGARRHLRDSERVEPAATASWKRSSARSGR